MKLLDAVRKRKPVRYPEHRAQSLSSKPNALKGNQSRAKRPRQSHLQDALHRLPYSQPDTNVGARRINLHSLVSVAREDEEH